MPGVGGWGELEIDGHTHIYKHEQKLVIKFHYVVPSCNHIPPPSYLPIFPYTYFLLLPLSGSIAITSCLLLPFFITLCFSLSSQAFLSYAFISLPRSFLISINPSLSSPLFFILLSPSPYFPDTLSPSLPCYLPLPPFPSLFLLPLPLSFLCLSFTLFFLFFPLIPPPSLSSPFQFSVSRLLFTLFPLPIFAILSFPSFLTNTYLLSFPSLILLLLHFPPYPFVTFPLPLPLLSPLPLFLSFPSPSFSLSPLPLRHYSPPHSPRFSPYPFIPSLLSSSLPPSPNPSSLLCLPFPPPSSSSLLPPSPFLPSSL